MKRSEINASISEAILFFKKMNFALPHYANWTIEQWSRAGSEYSEVIEVGLGWDVTDFGSGNFEKIGRTIFTLRNGKYDSEKYVKSYAQKAMFLQEEQKSVIHHHKNKMEDIYNLAGGNILIEFWNVGKNNEQDMSQVNLSLSGKAINVKAGEAVCISPGESVCIPANTYHRFWAEKKYGPVLSNEISTVCDDYNDNFFLSEGSRFPEIIEDESVKYVLCNEYKKL